VRRGLFTLALALLAAASCKPKVEALPERHTVREIGLVMPSLPGWRRDEAISLADPAKGGVAYRLVRTSSVAGSPRIDVIIDPMPVHPTMLEDVLARALRDMSDLQRRGAISVASVDRKPAKVGLRRGFRVTHAYNVGKDGGQVQITQSSVVFVLDGRGVTVSAVGRTELYTPLAQDIDRILSGLTVQVTPSKPAAPKAGKVGEAIRESPLTQPLELDQE
jgi:hypothetical protein